MRIERRPIQHLCIRNGLFIFIILVYTRPSDRTNAVNLTTKQNNNTSPGATCNQQSISERFGSLLAHPRSYNTYQYVHERTE